MLRASSGHTSASREVNFQNSICVVWSALVKSLEKAPSRNLKPLIALEERLQYTLKR